MSLLYSRGLTGGNRLLLLCNIGGIGHHTSYYTAPSNHCNYIRTTVHNNNNNWLIDSIKRYYSTTNNNDNQSSDPTPTTPSKRKRRTKKEIEQAKNEINSNAEQTILPLTPTPTSHSPYSTIVNVQPTQPLPPPSQHYNNIKYRQQQQQPFTPLQSPQQQQPKFKIVDKRFVQNPNDEDVVLKFAGIDEAGKGAVLGPLVISLVLLDKEAEINLKLAGVRDSKKLTTAQRETLYQSIKEQALYIKTIFLQASEIDEMRKSMTLNVIELSTFMDLIDHLKNEIESTSTNSYSNNSNNQPSSPPITIQVDSIENNPYKFSAPMRNRFPQFNIVCETKADDKYIATGAASIIAKVERDRYIQKLESHVRQPIGCGYPSDQQTISFIESFYQKNGFDHQDVRLSWKTLINLRSNTQQPSTPLLSTPLQQHETIDEGLIINNDEDNIIKLENGVDELPIMDPLSLMNTNGNTNNGKSISLDTFEKKQKTILNQIQNQFQKLSQTIDSLKQLMTFNIKLPSTSKPKRTVKSKKIVNNSDDNGNDKDTTQSSIKDESNSNNNNNPTNN